MRSIIDQRLIKREKTTDRIGPIIHLLEIHRLGQTPTVHLEEVAQALRTEALPAAEAVAVEFQEVLGEDVINL